MAASAAGLGGGAGPGPEPGDFLARYRQVSNKLKKRFLRKPNVAEAGEQFAQLGRELRAQECLPYAAWCQLAVARCQQALFHGSGEALALTEAARLFLRQERDARQRLACPAAAGEALQAAAAALGAAVRLHLELGQPAAAAALCLELAASLRDLGQPAAAAGHFQRAAQLQLPQLPLAALQALGHAASCQLLARDYSSALALFTRMQRLAQEFGGPPPQPLMPPPPPPGPQPAAPAALAPVLPPSAGQPATAAPAALGAFADVLVRCAQPLSPLQGRLAPRSEGKARAELRHQSRTTHGSHTPATCSFPGANARRWAGLGEARPGQSSLSAGALCYRQWPKVQWPKALKCYLASPFFREALNHSDMTELVKYYLG